MLTFADSVYSMLTFSNVFFSGYESQFDKKSFADELELSELENFFRECDLYPSNSELEDGIDVIFQGR